MDQPLHDESDWVVENSQTSMMNLQIDLPHSYNLVEQNVET